MIAGSNSAGGMDVNIVCHIKVSATGRSLVQRSPIKFGVYECYSETSKMRRSKPTGAVKPLRGGIVQMSSVRFTKSEFLCGLPLFCLTRSITLLQSCVKSGEVHCFL